MEVVAPWWLALALPGLLALIAPQGRGALRLPGDWGRLAEARLHASLARRVTGADGARRPLTLAALWALLALALADVALLRAAPAPVANLSARVLALDLSGQADVDDVRAAAAAVLDADPATPTAIVAVAGDAFDISPLTTDRAHTDRYLSVLSADALPAKGRALSVALAHAHGVLERAGALAGQIVVITGGPAPDLPRAPASDQLRALVVVDGDAGPWDAAATAWDATLSGPADVSAPIRALAKAARDRRRAADPGARLSLTPWLTGLALCLWLSLFRRRAA